MIGIVPLEGLRRVGYDLLSFILTAYATLSYIVAQRFAATP